MTRHMKKPAAVAEIRVPPAVVPFMHAHAQRAADCVNQFLAPCQSNDDRLGALGVLAQVLLACGDSIQAMELAKTKGTKQ